MRNCIILGSGRSGTSMLAGSLGQAGYYMGSKLIPPKDANPKGFFEDQEINGINEDLLGAVLPARPGGWLGRWYRHRPVRGQRWLAAVPLGVEFPCPATLAERMSRHCAQLPFCLKDPRFSYTLPAWRPCLGDAVFICIFREPARTAQSILQQCRERPYLSGLAMDGRRALRIWTLMYQHILQIHRHRGDWVFVHYEQVLDGSARPGLERVLGVRLDQAFPDRALRRSPAAGNPGREALRIYAELCELAGYGGGAVGNGKGT